MTTKNDAWKNDVSLYLDGEVQSLRKIYADARKGRDEVLRIAHVVSYWSAGDPLHLTGRRIDIEGYAKAVSGARATAMLVASLWVLCGENEGMAAPLVADWPTLKSVSKG